MRALLLLCLPLLLRTVPCGAQAPTFQLHGMVYVQGDTLPIAGADVEVTGTDGSQLTLRSDEAGRFQLTDGQLHADTRYTIRVRKEGYLTLMDELSTIGLTEPTTFQKEYYLKAIFVDRDPLVIPFGPGSAQLNTEGRAAADELTVMLTDNPTILLELRGRTAANEDSTLATARSNAVRRYLVKHGIRAERLRIGRANTAAATATARRVEFAVVGFDLKP